MSLDIPAFRATVARHGLAITRTAIDTVQVNVGWLCNQTCQHCHVGAGPARKEIMGAATVQRLLDLLADSPAVKAIDLTGGAPELNPHFRSLVRGAKARGKAVIDRCNLTILSEPGQEDTAIFLKEHQVEIVASLPCYTAKNVDLQRGQGVFERSIRALRLLNSLGYGAEDSGLRLHLVYNPVGPSLPPNQTSLKLQYKEELRRTYGIEFNELFTITNIPIKRFLRSLERSGRLHEYRTLLWKSFSPAAASQVMCRSLVSVDWQGNLYDCDFNQMLELRRSDQPKTLWDIASFRDLVPMAVTVGDHCYACTAGSGSSCRGALS